jgi:hypothetical protein
MDHSFQLTHLIVTTKDSNKIFIYVSIWNTELCP